MPKIGLLAVGENRLLLCRQSRGKTLRRLPDGEETKEQALERAFWPLSEWRAVSDFSDSAMVLKIEVPVVRENRLALCRQSRDTTLLILPGGKPDGEEMGTTVSAIEHFGRYEDKAAGDPRWASISLYAGVRAAEPGGDRCLTFPILQ